MRFQAGQNFLPRPPFFRGCLSWGPTPPCSHLRLVSRPPARQRLQLTPKASARRWSPSHGRGSRRGPYSTSFTDSLKKDLRAHAGPTQQSLRKSLKRVRACFTQPPSPRRMPEGFSQPSPPAHLNRERLAGGLSGQGGSHRPQGQSKLGLLPPPPLYTLFNDGALRSARTVARVESRFGASFRGRSMRRLILMLHAFSQRMKWRRDITKFQIDHHNHYLLVEK